MEDTRIIRYLTGSGKYSREEYINLRKFAMNDYTIVMALLFNCPPLDYLPLMFIFFVVSVVVYAFYTVIFILTCFYTRDDFVLWSEMVHHTGLVILAIFVRIHFIIGIDAFLTLTKLHRDGIFHYEEGLVDPVYQKLKEDSEKRQRTLIMVPIFIIGVTGAAVGLKPVLDYLLDVQPHPALLAKGINYKCAIPIYLPSFVGDDVTALIFINILLLYFAALVISCVISAELIFIRLASRIVLELATLSESLKLLDKRAKRLYVRRYGIKPPSRKNERWPLYQDCIESCLKENIQHHQAISRVNTYRMLFALVIDLVSFLAFSKCTFCVRPLGLVAGLLWILSFFELFSSIGGPVIGGGFAACTLVMGLGMIIMNMDDVQIGDQIAFTGAILAELFTAFMISWMSELIAELNNHLYNTVYGLNWFGWRIQNKKLVITFLEGTRKPLFVNAFGMAEINMETFGTVVNTSYSFLNLVKASESLEDTK